MIFAITLSYIRPVDQVKVHLDAHKAWLVQHIQAGTILFAGPLEQQSGGFILAQGEHLADIQKILDEDPFAVYQLVTFEIQRCEPAIRSSAFPEQWAPGAKAI
ncbi:YciI family protein [Pseudomonas asplenii]|uniref:YciI family protein n=1 Tax=Pseudomonas asplenii TaxID=53407 RepID=UPI00223490E8|nr:YciI family protein [Pseudomonas asplenii]UZE27475.1 YciI family protein [Pseudomonas asplenii]